MSQTIEAIVLACCEEHNAVSERKIDTAAGAAAHLYGSQGPLDSLGLVSLIVMIEQGIEDELDVFVTLADAKAASQQNSPFRTVGALAAYAQARVDEENGSNG
jgi:D-alanine--poly(phosphoribitol) ligase subunit 2